jgi:hypothetical protein
MELSPAATANFVRGELASALRSRRPYTVNLLLGGYDKIADKPTLYWIDYLASLAPVPYGAHGYAQYVFLVFTDATPVLLMNHRSGQRANLPFFQVLLSLAARQTPPPRHRLRARPQDHAHVHRGAQAPSPDRLQGRVRQGHHQGRYQGCRLRGRRQSLRAVRGVHIKGAILDLQ